MFLGMRAIYIQRSQTGRVNRLTLCSPQGEVGSHETGTRNVAGQHPQHQCRSQAAGEAGAAAPVPA